MVAPQKNTRMSFPEWTRKLFVSDPNATVKENTQRAAREYVKYISEKNPRERYL